MAGDIGETITTSDGRELTALTQAEMLRVFPGEGSPFRILGLHPEVTLRLEGEQLEAARRINGDVPTE